MDTFPSKQELDELSTFKEANCVTIYAPLIEPNNASSPSRIELKNMLREAESVLLAGDLQPRLINKTLGPARALIESREFWPVKGGSIVLFLHASLFRFYHLPTETLPSLLVIREGFDIKPLLQVMEDNLNYYVLALSHKHVRLYEGNHYQLKPIQLKNFPTDMKEALGIDEYPQARETHTIAPAGNGKGSEAAHQQYNVAQTDKAMLLEFFRRIDRRIHAFLVSHQKPLIIAGVSYLLPIYRKVNTYSGLVPHEIIGNQEHVDVRTIREKAWPLAKRTLT